LAIAGTAGFSAFGSLRSPSEQVHEEVNSKSDKNIEGSFCNAPRMRGKKSAYYSTVPEPLYMERPQCPFNVQKNCGKQKTIAR
jgi:hypothetical protein